MNINNNYDSCGESNLLDSQYSAYDSKYEDYQLTCLQDTSQEKTQEFEFMKKLGNQGGEKQEDILGVIQEESHLMKEGGEEDQYNPNNNSNNGINQNLNQQASSSNNQFKKIGSEMLGSNISVQSNIKAANSNNMTIKEKIHKISQEIDEIYESSQKEQVNNLNHANANVGANQSELNMVSNSIGNNSRNNMGNNSHHPNVSYPNNFSTNKLSANNNFNAPSGSPFNHDKSKLTSSSVSLNQSSNPPMKNFQIKSVNISNANSNPPFQGGPYHNPKAQMINNYTNQQLIANNQVMKSKGKPSINSGYNEMNINYHDNMSLNSLNNMSNLNNMNFNSFNNPHHLSEMSSNFILQTDDIISKTLNLLESIKGNFCMLIDNYKNKFSRDAELIKQILVAETEHILVEEEKNKMIDMRMETLFKEMMNLLNDFQRF